MYGPTKRLRLTLGNEYEIVEELKGNKGQWHTVPEEDLHRLDNELPLEHCPTLEIEINHVALKENFHLVIPPDCPYDDLANIVAKNMDKMLSVIIYVIEGILSEDVRIIHIFTIL